MKKILFYLSAFAVMLCTACHPSKKKDNVSPEIVEQSELVLENTISADREYMFMNYGENYRWYESDVLLKDYLDSEACDGTIVKVVNVFQVVTEYDSCADVHVIFFKHTLDSFDIVVEEGFWVEDYPLNDDSLAITYKNAYEQAMNANCPKPHSKHCVLRKEVGAKEANAQYIFGNTYAQIYVDAVTGEVNTDNPAFNNGDFGKPLGEWP